MEKGYIHLYTGDGKGKTTAALGLCLRASSHGFKCGFTSFLKDFTSGELLGNPPFHIFSGDPMPGFYCDFDHTAKMAVNKEAETRLRDVFDIAAKENYDLLVLDEIAPAISVGCIKEETLLTLLQQKPQELEVVLTGRDASKAICDIADYISEIRAIKHPYDKGNAARIGIEY